MYLPEEKFQAVMKALWDSRSEFPIVALTYASIREHKINYDFLRRNRDEATWLHMSQVPRVPAGATKAKHSEMHLPQIYGVDTVTTGIPWGGDSQKAAVDYEALRFFDKPTLSVPRIRDWKAEHQSESAACQCPACRGRPFSAIARETMEAASDEDRVSALFGVFRLHEVFESSVAFDEGRAYISENGFQEYLRERMGSGAAEFTA